MKLSYTKVETFKKCPKLYQLKYIQHLKEPETPELELGNFGHKVLENYYSNPLRSQELLNNLVTLYGGPHAEQLKEIFDGYHEFASKHDEGMGEIKAELELHKPVGHDVLIGKLDVLATVGGQKIIMDHKFKGKWSDTFEVSAQYEEQPKIYAYLSGQNLFFYNLIRTKPARTRPKFERIPVLVSETDKLESIANLAEWVRLIKNAETSSVFPRCAGYMSQWCPCRRMSDEQIPRVVIARESPHSNGGNEAPKGQ